MANERLGYPLNADTAEALREIAAQSPALARALSLLGAAVAERREARFAARKAALRQHHRVLVGQIAAHGNAAPSGKPQWPMLRLVVDNG